MSGGARGGGKSHWLLAQMGADDCQRVPGLKCLLLRKVGKAEAGKAPQLHTLDITDNFGQRSVITFNGFESNAALPAATFNFKPPAGADVLKE